MHFPLKLGLVVFNVTIHHQWVFFMFPLLLVANPFGEFMIESYISLPILTYQCFIYMIIYICVHACIIQNYDTKASAYPLCHGKTMGYLCLFSHKEVWSSHCHTRGQCTTGESHHFCAISVLLKNHHTMVQRWNHNLELSTSMGRPSWLYKVMVIHWKITGVSAGYPGYPQGKPRSAARQVPRDPALIHRRRPHRSHGSCAVGPLLQRLRSHTTRRHQRLKWAPACGQMWRFQREKNGDVMGI